ncbi:hypothetical protein I5Q34_27730 [Streptomyces sp. AV19]|nr:hypothetical protein [Streptomyces sp. AV19]
MRTSLWCPVTAHPSASLRPISPKSPAEDPACAGPNFFVSATDRDQAAELERLLAPGARPVDVGRTGTESRYVLADPEGNGFRLLHARIRPVWPCPGFRPGGHGGYSSSCL